MLAVKVVPVTLNHLVQLQRLSITAFMGKFAD
jgi:hypothetical protein